MTASSGARLARKLGGEIVQRFAAALTEYLQGPSGGQFWALLPYDSAVDPYIPFREGPWRPLPEQMVFSEMLCEQLNREIACDGVWAVGWADWSVPWGRPRRLLMAYFDADGDMPFCVDCEDRWPMPMLASKDDYTEQCLQAFNRWKGWEKDLEIRPADKIKAARGERSVDGGAANPLSQMAD